MSAWPPEHALDEIALKWRALAERRRAYFIELFQTGRWKRYFSEEQFMLRLREAIRTNERWAEIAPRPQDEVFAEQARTAAAAQELQRSAA
jgi:uncharacterized repeat protein (TIGR03809 family)